MLCCVCSFKTPVKFQPCIWITALVVSIDCSLSHVHLLGFVKYMGICYAVTNQQEVSVPSMAEGGKGKQIPGLDYHTGKATELGF